MRKASGGALCAISPCSGWAVVACLGLVTMGDHGVADLVVDLGKTTNTNNNKWARQTRLRRRCNAHFGSSRKSVSSDGGEETS